MKMTKGRTSWRLLGTPLVLGLLIGAAMGGQPRGRVELDLVGDPMGAALAFQEWGRALDAAGIRNVRLRTSQAPVRPGIETRGTPDSPIYVVTGIVEANELVLPSGRYRRGDLGRLAQWISELAELGPAERREARGAFGLTAPQLEQLLEDASQPVTLSTAGVARREVVERISRRLALPVRIDPAAAALLGDDPVVEELSDLSCGTALACVLRPAGLCLVPRPEGGRPAYGIVRAAPGIDIWPVGWEPKKPAREHLPGMYEFQNVNVQGVAVTTVLEAIGRQLNVPVLWDHNAMARHGIDPAKAPADHPQSRTTYSVALRRMLFGAGLKFEIRVDESDTPFLWITTVKPI
jgi:hypothetical protein